MPISKFFCELGILLLVGYSLSTHAQDPIYVTIGTAYSLQTNRVVYREAYTALSEQGEVKVNYFMPDGELFASKTLWYQGEPYQPEFELQDFRDKEMLSAKIEQARLVLRHQDKGELKQATIFDHATLVIDAGFDAYIQLHWDELSAGKGLSFEFALPNRLTSVKLSIEKISPQKSPIYDSQLGGGWLYFQLQPAKKWMRWFADPIYLAYDPNGKFLMRFYGRSNLDDVSGSPQDVRIEYEYF